MSKVITSIEHCTSAWLTEVLTRAGMLAQGAVRQVTVSRTAHMASLNYFLSLTYDAPTTAPPTLFLKLARPERLPLNESEVVYYQEIGAALALTPRCYDAQFDPASGAYHILLEDVSSTHGMVPFPLPPTRREAELMVDCLARLHLHWWEHPKLAQVAQVPTPEVIDRYVNQCEGGLAALIDFMGDRLSAQNRQIMEKIFAQHRHAMSARAAQNRHLTLIHGDSHAANFLVPLQPANSQIYLIDRQPFDWSLTCWLGVSDLTYLSIHWWYPERRRALEIPLLERYWARLQEGGIQDYAWEQLWYDYRLCAMQSLYVAVEWCRDDPPHEKAFLWYPQLQNTLTAIDDLACLELLGLYP